MFANPSGLAFVNGLDVSTTITNWIADIKHYGGGVAFQAGNIGTFGVSFVAMDYGDIKRTVPYEGSDPVSRNQGYVEMGTFTVNEFAFGLAYAREVVSDFYVGGHFRFATQDLGSVEIFDEIRGQEIEVDNKVENIVIDIGTMYYPGWRDLRFGMSIRNFSNQSDYYNQRFELPLTFDFGIAMDVLPFLSAAENQELTLAVDWLHPRDFSERLHIGAEYGFMDTLFLRAGYKFNYDEEGFSGGLGAQFGVGGYGLRVGYSYTAFGDLFGSVNRVSVGLYGLQ
jgi:hypothetical protein